MTFSLFEEYQADQTFGILLKKYQNFVICYFDFLCYLRGSDCQLWYYSGHHHIAKREAEALFGASYAAGAAPPAAMPGPQECATQDHRNSQSDIQPRLCVHCPSPGQGQACLDMRPGSDTPQPL